MKYVNLLTPKLSNSSTNKRYRTKAQLSIVEEYPNLPSIPHDMIIKKVEEELTNVIPYYTTEKKGIKKCYCPNCGTKFVGDKESDMQICPECGTEKKGEYFNQSVRYFSYKFSFGQFYKEYFVVRTIIAEYHIKECMTIISEVYQKWIDIKKNKLCTSTLTKGWNCFLADFKMWGEYSFLRKLGYSTYSASKRDYDTTSIELLNEDKDNPLFSIVKKAVTYTNTTHDMFCDILETLYYSKTNQENNSYVERFINMQEYIFAYAIKSAYYPINGGMTKDELYRTLLICHRHKIQVDMKHLSLFIDYIRDLIEFKKDNRNPFYLNKDIDEIRQIHNRYTQLREIKRAEERKREEERRVLENKKNRRDYHKRLKFFATLVIADENITIKPIKTLKDMAEEGRAMKHCIFANDYFNKKNSLLLSARDKDDKRIETIEYDLVRKKILQHYGKCNQQTKYGNEIVSLISGAVNDIHKCYLKYQNKTTKQAV